MTIHYTDDHGQALCNRASFYSDKTADPSKVTCRSCMRAMARLAAQHEKITEWARNNREGSTGYRTGDN